MEIPVRCFTALDVYQYCQWPNVFYSPPQVGHKVRAKDGKELKVIGITHCWDGLSVELNK